MNQITKRLSKKSSGSPMTKKSKQMRKSHRRDDVRLLKQDLKYNLSHASDHKKQAQVDRRLIKKKTWRLKKRFRN